VDSIGGLKGGDSSMEEVEDMGYSETEWPTGAERLVKIKVTEEYDAGDEIEKRR